MFFTCIPGYKTWLAACLSARPPGGRNESVEDMDLQVSPLTPFGLARGLPLGDVRPKWASSVQPWWDLDCDRDLLLGTFLHGFGAYPKMKADPRLCFTAKVLHDLLAGAQWGGKERGVAVIV